MIDTFKLEALVNWLIAGAPPKAAFTETVAELVRGMVGCGLPVDALTLHTKNFNPTLFGTRVSWTPERGIQMSRYSHEQMATVVWIGSAPYHAIEAGRVMVGRFGTGAPHDAHYSSQRMKERGYTAYVICPLFSKFTPTGAVSVYTKRPEGFTAEAETAIRRLQAPLARVAEAEALHSNTVSLLSTYVGRNAGDKVMDGRILRGHSETITAVILFADLSNFTALSNTLTTDRTIGLLNAYFEALDSAIRANGGETLKFIGDGLLAIFPTQDEIAEQTAAAMGAISALDDARAALARAGGEGPDIAFRAALHIGEVSYGNIGSANRLDFTAVGPSVNLTARMLQASTELDARTVCSDAFAPLTRGRAKPARAFAFKGFAEAVMVHVVG
ncbi:MAG: adenylate/guanylate cyclase domain-containing protein [Paracoccaceae bacterium]